MIRRTTDLAAILIFYHTHMQKSWYLDRYMGRGMHYACLPISPKQTHIIIFFFVLEEEEQRRCRLLLKITIKLKGS